MEGVVLELCFVIINKRKKGKVRNDLFFKSILKCTRLLMTEQNVYVCMMQFVLITPNFHLIPIFSPINSPLNQPNFTWKVRFVLADAQCQHGHLYMSLS